MGITEDIRKALRNAPGPLNTDDLRQLLEGDYTSAQLCNNLKSMTKSGEVLFNIVDGYRTFLIDPAWKPKRTRASDAAAPVPENSIRDVVEKVRGAKPAAEAASASDESVSVPRKQLRFMAAALIELHRDRGPMPPELKQAVLAAMHAAI